MKKREIIIIALILVLTLFSIFLTMHFIVYNYLYENFTYYFNVEPSLPNLLNYAIAFVVIYILVFIGLCNIKFEENRGEKFGEIKQVGKNWNEKAFEGLIEIESNTNLHEFITQINKERKMIEDEMNEYQQAIKMLNKLIIIGEIERTMTESTKQDIKLVEDRLLLAEKEHELLELYRLLVDLEEQYQVSGSLLKQQNALCGIRDVRDEISLLEEELKVKE